MADFAELEEADGVRLTWNVWPSTRVEAAKCVVPFAALYSPVKPLGPNAPVVSYDPVRCKGCGGVLNPYAAVDFQSRLWTCALCHSRNAFPAHYAGISDQNLPAELFPTATTIEYQTAPSAPISPPAYVFVLDAACPGDELAAARRALGAALDALPDYSRVGLVTFGTHVQVHELGFSELAKSYVFQGGREYTPAAIASQLGLGGGPPPGMRGPGGAPAAGAAAPEASRSGGARFIVPLSECEFTLNNALDELSRDAFAPAPDCRPARCTGTALVVAAALAAAALPPGTCAARVLLLVGGPSTDGAGAVVGRPLAEPIRSHKDLAKDAAPHFTKACKHYAALAASLAGAGHALDVYACSLDQVGIAEMKPAVERTGGLLVQADTFANPVFRESLKRALGGGSGDAAAGASTSNGDAALAPPEPLGVASNGILEVVASRDVRVAGLLGPASPCPPPPGGRKNPALAESSVGLGGTTAWKLPGLDARSTVAVYFEAGGAAASGAASNGIQGGPGGPGAAGPQLYIQFVTRYLHATGAPRTRVTTLTRRWVDGAADGGALVAGFDQEAAAVAVARLATFKMETEEDFDATRWLDRTLIRLCARFGEYRRDDPASFGLQPGLAFFPQFMFNLRRSPFVQVFGASPDETAAARLALCRERVADAMVMIQPTLLAYSLNKDPSQPEPVLLDVASIAPDRILLLDAFFYVVVFHGVSFGVEKFFFFFFFFFGKSEEEEKSSLFSPPL